jgi:hypothetical protein
LPLAFAEAEETASIEALLARLGSENFEQRDEATRLLFTYEDDAIPGLRKATQSTDPDVRKRAGELIADIQSTIARRELARAVRLSKEGAFEESLSRLVRWAEEDAQEAGLEVLARLAGNLVEREKQRFGNLRFPPVEDFPLLAGDLRTFVKKYQPEVEIVRSRLPLVYENRRGGILRGAGVCVNSRMCGLVASSGEVTFSKGGVHGTVIFACGSVNLEDGGHGSLIIVAGGDVAVRGRVYDSLIIARGNTTLPPSVSHSSIFAGGSAATFVPSPRGYVISPQRPNLHNSILRENDTDGLGVVRFFDEREEGIEVLPNKCGVLVKEARRDRPYAALRPGDVITAIDGIDVSSPDTFRTTLRMRLAEGNRFLRLSLHRAGDRVELRVPRGD